MKTIGWIGTGVMGVSMAKRLIENNYQCFVFNRTKEKAESLLNAGAKWCASPAKVAQQTNIIFTIVGYPEDVEEVYLGQDGLLPHASPGSILIDMTTTSPSLAEDIHGKGAQKSIKTIDAPISGGDVGAKSGTLSIMAGGDKADVDLVMPLFQLMGKNIVYQGKAGSGQHTKMCNQITIAGTMIGVCESLLYGIRAGLHLETVLQSISGGAAQCWTLDNLAPRIIKEDFEPGFYIDHFIKDMGIALEEAKKMNLSLPGLELVKQIYQSAQAKGYGKKGTQALYLALKEIADKN